MMNNRTFFGDNFFEMLCKETKVKGKVVPVLN
jgi:hypothetical protein